MFPREATEQNGDAVTFRRRKGPFDRTAKVRRRVARLLLETSALLRDALLNLLFKFLSRFQRFQQQGRLWFEVRRCVNEDLLDDAHTKSTRAVHSVSRITTLGRSGGVRILVLFLFRPGT